MRTGTCHFTSTRVAERYYKEYNPSMTPAQLQVYVAQKVLDREISIGPPHLAEGQVCMADAEGRYWIADREPAQTPAEAEKTPPAPDYGHRLLVWINLPPDFGIGWDYSLRHTYPVGHSWAGSYSHTTEHNLAHNQFWEHFQPEETQDDLGGGMDSALFEISSASAIAELKQRVYAFCAKYPVQDDRQRAYMAHVQQCELDHIEPKSQDDFFKEMDDE